MAYPPVALAQQVATKRSTWFQKKIGAIPRCDAVSDLDIPHNLDLITNGLARAV
jgi:hypothetical protein